MTSADEATSPFAELEPEFLRLGEFLTVSPGEPLRPARIVEVAAATVPNAAHCAITVIRGGSQRPKTMASTGELPDLVDAIQYDSGEGPCLDATEDSDLIVVTELAGDERWPEFARRCTAQTPVRSMLGVRLLIEGRDRAAMNLYAEEPGQFDDLAIGVASMFAPFVALSVQSALNEERATNLEEALRTSRQIGTAMGILMARELITSDEAFKLLSQASQHLNRKLRDIAVEVELTGALPSYQRDRKDAGAANR